MWFPGMDREAEQFCKGCFECQMVSRPGPPEPVVSTKLPDKAWQHLAIDILGPLPNGESLIVVVDYYSRYYEVEFMRSTTSGRVIEFCEGVFSRWGLPVSMRTDNGTQFASTSFLAYLRDNNVRWLSTTPLWPSANGEVERQNRSILKSLKVAAT